MARLVPALLCALRAAERKAGIEEGYGADVSAAWAGVGGKGEAEEDESPGVVYEAAVTTTQSGDESLDEFGVFSKAPPQARAADRDEDLSSPSEEEGETGSEGGALAQLLSMLQLDEGRGVEDQHQAAHGAASGGALSLASPTAEAEQAAAVVSRARIAAASSGAGQRSRLCVVTPYEGQRALVEMKICDALRRDYGSGHTGRRESDMSVWARASRTVGNVRAKLGNLAFKLPPQK